MFDVSEFPEVPTGEALTEFEEAGEEDGWEGKGRGSVVDLEEQLRGTMQKLAYCGSTLGPLPDGCSYTVALELKETKPPPIGVSSRPNPSFLLIPCFSVAPGRWKEVPIR